MAGYSSLNSSAVRELASLVLFENIVQEVMVIPGRSADFRYATDINAKTVTVNRVKLVNGGREIGASTNGGWFNTGTGSAESELFDIPLQYVFDKPIKIAQVQDDMSGGTMLRGMLMNVPKSIAKFTNCMYFGSILCANLNAGIGATSADSTVTYTYSTDYITKLSADTTAGAMAGLNAISVNLGKGDADHGFDIFDLKESVIYATSDLLGLLRGSSNFIVNNPLGQEMIASGSFTAFDTSYRPDAITGYQGEFIGMLIYHLGSLATSTLGFLGQETIADGSKAAISATDALDNLLGIVVNGRAIGGGMTLGDVKVVDARGGQGWEIQPLSRCGFGVFSAKGVQTLWKNAGPDGSDFVTYTGSGTTATKTKKLALYLPENRA